jgi:hypothetical protein
MLEILTDRTYTMRFREPDENVTDVPTWVGENE